MHCYVEMTIVNSLFIQYLDKRRVTSIRRENFSFSTKLIIGDFLRPSGETDDITGEEKYLRLTENQMKDEIDKVRKENGWKPRKRIGPLSSRDGGRKSNGDRSSSSEPHNVEDQYKLLQRLQVNIARIKTFSQYPKISEKTTYSRERDIVLGFAEQARLLQSL